MAVRAAVDECEVGVPTIMQRITGMRLPCPQCQRPIAGARIYDPVAREAFIGGACTSCDSAFRLGTASMLQAHDDARTDYLRDATREARAELW